jgi:hypothetical protein
MNGYTGKLLEEEILGRCLHVGESYLSYRKSMEAVKNSQPWDTSDPDTRVASDLHAHVAIALGLEDWTQLQLFTAVGSSLDRFHRVDAFFEFNGHVVTFDLTMNPHKDEYHADLILQYDTIERGGLEKFGREVAELLLGAP